MRDLAPQAGSEGECSFELYAKPVSEGVCVSQRFPDFRARRTEKYALFDAVGVHSATFQLHISRRVVNVQLTGCVYRAVSDRPPLPNGRGSVGGPGSPNRGSEREQLSMYNGTAHLSSPDGEDLGRPTRTYYCRLSS